MSTDAERIARYRDTIRETWRQGDSNAWPVKLNAAFHLFLSSFGDELLDDMAALEQSGWTAIAIARLFYNPARLYRVIDAAIYSMRRRRMSLRDQRAVVLKFLDMARMLKHGSEFNDDGRNAIWSPSKANEIAASVLGPAPCSLAESRTIHRFCGLMWAYTEAIMFRAHDVTKESHGPYAVPLSDRSLIVKEYLNLRPCELWEDVPLLPCSSMVVFKDYESSVRFRMDALNHLYHEGGQLVPGLARYAVHVDGAPVGIDVVEEYLRIMPQTIHAISSRLREMDWHGRVEKYAEVFWYRKKPLRDARELTWQVPDDVRAAIRRGEENPRRATILSEQDCERLAMLTI